MTTFFRFRSSKFLSRMRLFQRSHPGWYLYTPSFLSCMLSLATVRFFIFAPPLSLLGLEKGDIFMLQLGGHFHVA